MTTKEIRDEELEERKQEKTANNCNRYLEGKLFQGEAFVIQKLKGSE